MSGVANELARAREADWRKPWLVRRAELTPASPALVFADRRLDYRELLERTRAAARALSACGVSPGAILAVQLPNTLAMVEIVHAGFLLGCTVQLVHTRLTPAEIEHQLDDSGAGFFAHLADDPAAGRVSLPSGVARLPIGDPASAASVTPAAGRAREPEASFDGEIDFAAPRFILYTSGTSGRPKGVALDAANLFASARAQASLLGSEAADRWLLCLPLFHVGGLSILLRSVLVGSCVVLHERFDPERVAVDLEAEAITGVSWVAHMLARVLDVSDGRNAPASLSCVLLGGGATPEPLVRAALASGFPIAPTYGLTEAASQVATCPPGGDARLGLPLLPGTEARIVDQAGCEVSPGTPGEICLRGPTLAQGYHGDPRASAEAYRDGWFHTGDVGAIDREGRLRVFDRRRDLIVSGGENVYPAEIEAVLLAHANVAEAGVAGIPDARFGARPAAWIVARRAPDPTPEELAAFCRERLAGYKCPVVFECVEALPRNATGKLLRGELGRTPG